MVLEDQRGVGGVIPGETALDECSFAAGDLGRPSNCFGRLEISCHVGTPEYSRF